MNAQQKADAQCAIIAHLGFEVTEETRKQQLDFFQAAEQRKVRDEMIAEVAPMLDAVRVAIAGTYIVDTEGVDLQQPLDWKDEAVAQEADAQDWQGQITELRGG